MLLNDCLPCSIWPHSLKNDADMAQGNPPETAKRQQILVGLRPQLSNGGNAGGQNAVDHSHGQSRLIDRPGIDGLPPDRRNMQHERSFYSQDNRMSGTLLHT